MRTIYLDEQFCCHPSPAPGLTAVETDVFDGMCDACVEGCRFVPEESAWLREDGEVFSGEMLSPILPPEALMAAQRQYEQLLQKLETAYRSGVNQA